MIVLFDGVCNLCSRWVQFILPRDEAGRIRFASLQSTYARTLLKQHGLSAEGDPTSIVLFTEGRVYERSSAVLRIFGALRFPWNLLVMLLAVPPFLRDPIYRFVAARRYRLFGKREECWLPQPEWKDRFVDGETSPIS